MDTSFKPVINADLSTIIKEFNNWHISAYKNSFGSAQIVAYCCQSASLENLTKQWQQLNSYIAAKYVARKTLPFERWNSYLLFVCAEKIPNPLRFEIENNKFAMRKIVIGGLGAILSDADLTAILNREILSSEIVLTNEGQHEIEPLAFSAVTKSLIAAQLQPGRGIAQEERERWLNNARKHVTMQLKDNDNED